MFVDVLAAHCLIQPLRAYASEHVSISCCAIIGKTPGVDALLKRPGLFFGSLNTAGEAHAAIRIAEMITSTFSSLSLSVSMLFNTTGLGLQRSPLDEHMRSYVVLEIDRPVSAVTSGVSTSNIAKTNHNLALQHLDVTGPD